MSSLETATVLAPSLPDRRFEELIFDISPLSCAATAALIFLLWFGAFCGAMVFEHNPFFDPHSKTFGLAGGVWPAIILSSLVAVSLGMQRYARQRDLADAANYTVIFSQASGPQVFFNAETGNRMTLVTLLAVVLGTVLTFTFTPFALLDAHAVLFTWFFLIEVFVVVLFARGIVKSMRAAALFAHSIDNNLQLDLLRIDLLTVIGRNSARTALIWFSVAAVICLFFVGDEMGTSTFITLLVAAGMGVWIFLRPMERVHRRIRAAKMAELEAIRRDIAGLRGLASGDTSAATRLQALLAYETRIEAVREWPFDQSTGMRLGAYLLIPAIPWFGQAMAGYFVEHFAR